MLETLFSILSYLTAICGIFIVTISMTLLSVAVLDLITGIDLFEKTRNYFRRKRS